MTDTATFALGCFWEPDTVFSNIDGVTKVTVGYTGGHTVQPTYEQVCSGQTGHAEAVEIKFDPDKISYEQLLRNFWDHHNPTTLNRQGPDVGEQYRSAIFYHSEDQKTHAESSKAELESSGKWNKPIVTKISPAGVFYPAEDYHQKYLVKRGLATCKI
jgi:peptide-methionine (S)-S-oxide reductase